MNGDSKICPICGEKFTLDEYKIIHGNRIDAWERKKYCDICKKLPDKEKAKQKILREHNLQKDNGSNKRFTVEAELWERHKGNDTAFKIEDKIYHINGFDSEEEQRWKNKYESLEEFIKKREIELLNERNEILIKYNRLETKIEELKIPKNKTKKCKKCNLSKEITLFEKCQRHSDGLQSYCKDCMNQIQKEHRKKKHEIKQLLPMGKGEIFEGKTVYYSVLDLLKSEVMDGKPHKITEVKKIFRKYKNYYYWKDYILTVLWRTYRRFAEKKYNYLYKSNRKGKEGYTFSFITKNIIKISEADTTEKKYISKGDLPLKPRTEINGKSSLVSDKFFKNLLKRKNK